MFKNMHIFIKTVLNTKHKTNLEKTHTIVEGFFWGADYRQNYLDFEKEKEEWDHYIQNSTLILSSAFPDQEASEEWNRYMQKQK